MLLSLLTGGGSLTDILISLLLSLPMIFLALSIHETAHGYVAWKCGDPTAHNLGRLTLNPFKHIDPMGALCMILFGFGWAKPVPINTRNFSNPKRGMALSAAAGPAANLILGLIFSVLYGAAWAYYSYLFYAAGEAAFATTCMYWVLIACNLGAQYNLFLMLFNLIPIPPFDGSRIAFSFLPSKYYFGIMRYERYIMIGLLVALFAFDRIFSFSPIGWVVDKILSVTAEPICKLLFENVFLKLLLK